MVTKLKKTPPPAQDSSAHISGSVKDSAQQIWQAGLGAFAKAQAEGTRAFEALVKEGTTLQRKTQAAAEEKISEATSRMSNMATDISSKASGHWDKLENIFEERVAKALNKLGVPSAKDISALIARIDELNLSVQKLSGTAPAKTRPAAARKTAAKSAPADITAAAAQKPATKTAAKPAAKRAAPRKPA
jgi:poly(hydroxyalkanoate) granule-associated protein